jgi:hypothetical protein
VAHTSALLLNNSIQKKCIFGKKKMGQSLKQQVLEKISATEDEGLLSILMEDIGLYEKHHGLAAEDFEELKELANEPNEKDTTSFSEFKELIQQWRTN